MARRIRLDHAGMAQMLKSDEVASAIGALAEGVASALREDAAVQRHAVPVEVERYTTDRAAAAVLLKHPAGLPIQAKHGSVTRAAAATGLEVHDR